MSAPIKILKYPIVFLTTSFATGIAISFIVNISLFASTVVFAIAALLCSLSYLRKRSSLVSSRYFESFACLAFLSGGLLTATLHNPLARENHYTKIGNQADTVSVIGVITERLKPNEYAEKYYLDVRQCNGKSATGKLLVTVAKDSLNRLLHNGDIIVAVAPLTDITNAPSPYSFDYAAYMHRQGVYRQLRLKNNYIVSGEERNFNYYVGRFRTTLISSFDAHHYDQVTGNVIKALVFGQRQDMDKATTDDYTKAGVIHVLAISGLHFAVLFFIFNMLLKPLERTSNGRLAHFLIMMALLWGFAFIAGLSASVVRSVVMFTFISFGNLLNRRSGNSINSIAVSMLVLLLFEPGFLLDVGFQLSYAAIIGILWLHPVLRMRRSKYKLINLISDMATVSIAAQIGVLPLTLYYFHQFPLLFLVANIIVIPLSNIVLVGSVVVLLLNFTWTDAALVLGRVLELTITIMNKAISVLASVDWLILKNIPFNLYLAITLCLCVATFALWLYQKSYTRTVALLSSVAILQLAYSIAVYNAKFSEEAIVLSERKSPTLLFKNSRKLTVYSNDSLIKDNHTITDYNRAYFNAPVEYKGLSNVLYVRNKKLLVMDSTAVYLPSARPDVVVLTYSPKVNLERMITDLKPKAIVADATNYRTYVKRWAATCTKQNIPFHATAEKGYYIIK